MENYDWLTQVIWLDDTSGVEPWPLHTDNIYKVLQRGCLKHGLKWASAISKVMFNANDDFYFNASYFVRTCWTSIQNTVYYSFFKQKSWAG